MTLAAAQIVDAVAARLRGGPLAGDDVYTSRAWPLTERNLPAWRVYASDESVRPLTVAANPLQQHELQVELAGYVRAVDDVDDALHALTVEGLTRIYPPTAGAPDALDALMPRMQLHHRRTERFMQPEGEATLGKVVLTLLATYRTRANAPEALV